MRQAPLEQFAVPLVSLHFMPQALQFDASFLRLASQPLVTLPSQSP